MSEDLNNNNESLPEPALDRLLDEWVTEERTRSTPNRLETERFLQRFHERLRPARTGVLRGWRWAAAVPLFVAATFWWVSGSSQDLLTTEDREVVELLDELRLLDGLAPEDLEELDPNEIVSYLEAFELLDNVDTELLQEEG